jgi:hypothetical protein
MTTPGIAGLCKRLRDNWDWPSLLMTEAADTIERQADEIKRLQNLLNGRDDFIVGEGLWPKFCDGLPPRAALTGEDTISV